MKGREVKTISIGVDLKSRRIRAMCSSLASVKNSLLMRTVLVDLLTLLTNCFHMESEMSRPPLFRQPQTLPVRPHAGR